ncbi:MAG: hypothetical protein KDB80_05570 [Planctomycetes bacterium]|nr:hypothetical protein [Planctomycetota bacterium]
MKNLIGIGLALAATSSFATANGNPTGDTPVPYFADTKVAYKVGKGLMFDGGESFSATLSHRIQVQWRYINVENAADTNGAQARRLRQTVKGHAFNKDVTYMFNVEHAEAVSVKDIWLNWMFMKGDDMNIGLRLGQGKGRAGLQSDGSSGKLFHIERSSATRTFADSRVWGALFQGTAAENNLGWHFGIFNQDSAARSTAAAEENNNAGQNEVNFSAGVRFSPNGLGDAEAWSEGDLEQSGDLYWQAGANVFVGNETTGAADVEITTININAAMKSGTGIAAQGEVWLRNDDVDGGTDADSMGWYAQGSWTCPKEEGKTQWGAGVRISMVDFSDVPVFMTSASGLTTTLAGAEGDVTEINAVFNQFYYGHALKSQFGYTYQDVNPMGGGDMTNHGIEFMVTGNF